MKEKQIKKPIDQLALKFIKENQQEIIIVLHIK